MQFLKLNKEKIGDMNWPKEAEYLLQLTVCEIFAKVMWNHEGSSDLTS